MSLRYSTTARVLTQRQLREIEFHRQFARKRAQEGNSEVDLDVVFNPQRRWWNAYWHAYTLLRRLPLSGARALIPGCGDGPDAIRLAALGAEVHGFDISPEMIDLARRRVARLADANISLDVCPSEALPYPDDYFDVVLFVDILHHVDIPRSLAEVRRVMKPGGTVVGIEIYTHDLLQKVRNSRLVDARLYPLMKRFIYRTDDPYITADEHKINQEEFAEVSALCPDLQVEYFCFVVGRLIPQAWHRGWHKLDRRALQMLGRAGRLAAGRVVFQGSVAK